MGPNRMGGISLSRIIVDEERCRGCGLCIVFCPRQVLAVAERFNHDGLSPVEQAHQENCIGCATCALMCPHVAIMLVERTKAEKTEEAKA
jgi:2-oxoglutarate ferredoxin oxidoreductase subunit delta